jgi:signal peptidase
MIVNTSKPGSATRGGLGYILSVGGSLTKLFALAVLLTAVALSLGVALLPAAGYQTTVIDGGSMEPTIQQGALVISRPVSPDSLQIGDVITYRRPDAQASVTHRIVAEHDADGKRSFTMKGDNNESPDPTGISFSSDTPRVIFVAPYAGYVVAFLHSPSGMLLVTALPAIGLAAMFVLSVGRERADEESTEA